MYRREICREEWKISYILIATEEIIKNQKKMLIVDSQGYTICLILDSHGYTKKMLIV